VFLFAPEFRQLFPDCRAALRNHRTLIELLRHKLEEPSMDGIVYLVGLIVIVMFVLSLFGLR
jgi:hypothetical protein